MLAFAGLGWSYLNVLPGWLGLDQTGIIPLPDDSVDVVISNCVINLAADKAVGARPRPGCDHPRLALTRLDRRLATTDLAKAMAGPEQPESE